MRLEGDGSEGDTSVDKEMVIDEQRQASPEGEQIIVKTITMKYKWCVDRGHGVCITLF